MKEDYNAIRVLENESKTEIDILENRSGQRSLFISNFVEKRIKLFYRIQVCYVKYKVTNVD